VGHPYRDVVIAAVHNTEQAKRLDGHDSLSITLDAALGVTHRQDPLRGYLAEMRDYMPPAHRAFLQAVEAGPSIREHVLARSGQHAPLRDAYNACVHYVESFRARHLEYAARYIHQQSEKTAANFNDVGTGGTPFMPYLKKHRDETAEFEIK
jgi:indoleamine 2,3-dioxygenase